MSEQTRKDFEAWVGSSPYERSLERFPGDHGAWPGNYKFYDTQLAWEAWQTAKANQQAAIDAALKSVAQWCAEYGYPGNEQM